MPKRDDLFVDTSGWSCYLNNEERFHSIITAFVANVLKKHQRLITTNYVIAELVALLSSCYPLPRSQVITWINEIKEGLDELKIIITPLNYFLTLRALLPPAQYDAH